MRRKKRREEVDKYKGEKIKKTKVLLLTKVNHYKRRKKKKDPQGCTKKWTPKGTKKCTLIGMKSHLIYIL